jgi:hypothetical protein
MSHKAQNKVNQQGFHPAGFTFKVLSHPLHVSAVLTANFKQRIGNLTQ